MYEDLEKVEEFSDGAPTTEGLYETRYEKHGIPLNQIVYVYWDWTEPDRLGPLYDKVFYDDIEGKWTCEHGGLVAEIAHNREWREVQPTDELESIL